MWRRAVSARRLHCQSQSKPELKATAHLFHLTLLHTPKAKAYPYQIANDLASAFKIDPAGRLPWAEWLELLNATENDEDGFCVTPKDQVLSIELWKRRCRLTKGGADNWLPPFQFDTSYETQHVS